jgi:hypothetical protein
MNLSVNRLWLAVPGIFGLGLVCSAFARSGLVSDDFAALALMVGIFMLGRWSAKR